MIASSRTLLTKRTTGASSTSSAGSRLRFGVPTADIEILEVEIVVVQAAHAGVDGFDRLADAFFQLVLFDDDRVDAQRGGELDVVDGLQIGWVGNAEKQALAALYQRQYAVLRNEFLVDEPNDVEIDFDRVEIE